MHDHGPALVNWLLAAVCAGAGTYCLARLRHARSRRDRHTHGLEGAMGWGMAVMALPAGPLAGLSPEAAAATLTTVFAATGGWALAAAGGGAGHRAHHLTGSAAMVYMTQAMAPSGPVEGGHPVVTGALLLYFTAHALAGARQLVPGPPAAAPGRTTGPPEVAAACRTALTLAMVAMLLTV